MGRARKRIKDLITRVEGLVRTNAIAEPDWLSEIHKCPPPPIPLRRKIPNSVLPQDRLAKIYARNQRPLPVRVKMQYSFANEQFKLMERGMSEEEAYRVTNDKYKNLEMNEDGELEKANPKKWLDEYYKEVEDNIRKAVELEKEQEQKFKAYEEERNKFAV